MTKQDVTIVGGGLAGLSLALQCRQQLPNARILVLEKNEHPVPEAAFKVGESTVEAAATYFGEVLGLRDHIQSEQLPKLGLRFFFPRADNAKISERLELGGRRYAPVKSYQLDRGRFENYLAGKCQSMGIEFLDGTTVQDIGLGVRGSAHQVQYQRKGKENGVETRWVVDASGRRAMLKRKLGMQKESPHKANAVWFRFPRRVKVDDWSSDAEWLEPHTGKLARWYSTNHLMGTGYWVWLIPLSSGSTSVGIVASESIHPLSSFNSPEKAMNWLRTHEAQCAEQLASHWHEMQDFLAIKRYATECGRVFGAKRWGIVGEAGFFHDPFYSPGSDFIAFANTLLCDLIHRDLTGRGHRIRAFAYDRIFKRFYHGTTVAYLDQYQLFGNHQIMPVKILWDYLMYWSITAFIFMHGRMCQQMMYMRHLSKLSRLSKLNHAMQAFFRKWHHARPSREIGGTVDISRIPIIRETNQRLLDDLTNREFATRFTQNVAQVETLFWEIVDHADVPDVSFPFKRTQHPGARKNVLREVFDVTTAIDEDAALPRPLSLVTD